MSRTRIAVLAVVALTLLIPIAASAATSLFDDVPDNSVYVDDITWLANAGVTKGCNPPTNTKFCPSSNVTREQMAAFMHRLATNQVVDAATVEGLTPAELKGQQGDIGPAGPQGEKGDNGNTGPQGPAGIAGYYIVEEIHRAPNTIPEPPKPYPNDESGRESLVIPAGEPLAQCSPGDVAVDGSHLIEYTIRDTDTGTYSSDSIARLFYFAAYPFAGSEIPTGYTSLGKVQLEHEWATGGTDAGITNFERTQTLVVRITCADLTQ